MGPACCVSYFKPPSYGCTAEFYDSKQIFIRTEVDAEKSDNPICIAVLKLVSISLHHIETESTVSENNGLSRIIIKEHTDPNSNFCLLFVNLFSLQSEIRI